MVRKIELVVTLAKAGVYLRGEGRWIPACAGMTLSCFSFFAVPMESGYSLRVWR